MIKTLVDTSVWINHFRKTDAHLLRLLDTKLILIHPLILGELAAGNIKNRMKVLSDLQTIPLAEKAPDEWILKMIDKNKLFGIGLSYTDLQILASALLTPCELYTHDKQLQKCYMRVLKNTR